MKHEILASEIDLIKNEKIKQFTINTLNNAPDYFFEAPASSTGKYHPECTCKKGGLIVHVKRAVFIANRLCEGWAIFDIERDIVLSATILHDIAKTGKGQGSFDDYNNHPINANKYFTLLEDENIKGSIRECVKHHMGRWTPDSVKKEIKKYSLMELLVYTADYIAATKTLTTPKDN